MNFSTGLFRHAVVLAAVLFFLTGPCLGSAGQMVAERAFRARAGPHRGPERTAQADLPETPATAPGTDEGPRIGPGRLRSAGRDGRRRCRHEAGRRRRDHASRAEQNTHQDAAPDAAQPDFRPVGEVHGARSEVARTERPSRAAGRPRPIANPRFTRLITNPASCIAALLVSSSAALATSPARAGHRRTRPPR